MTLDQALNNWLREFPGIFAARPLPNGIHLQEVSSHKDRVILFAEVSQWRRKANPTGEADYINLVFEDGHELVLCHAGFAFAPSYMSTGDAVQLPAVVCMQDYHRFRHHLQHLVKSLGYTTSEQSEQKEEAQAPMKMEALRTMMSCLATLEGAKLVGLDVSEEERVLEPILNWLDTH